MFEGTVAGPLAMCVKAGEGMDMDDLLQDFVDHMESSIVVSDKVDMGKVDEILYSFYSDHPNLNKYKYQIHMRRMEYLARAILALLLFNLKFQKK